MAALNGKAQRFEKLPYKKENFKVWNQLFRQRCARYGFLDILDRTRVRLEIPAFAETSPSPERLHAIHEAQAIFDYDLVQLKDFFYMCMGDEGIAELQLAEDDFEDIFVSYHLIKKVSTILIDQEINTITEQFTSLPGSQMRLSRNSS
jgi:hypothetical protein